MPQLLLKQTLLFQIFLGLTCIPASVGAERGISTPELAKLKLVATSENQGRLVTYRDIESGAKLKATYDSAGRILTMEEYAPSGALLNRRTFESGTFRSEDFLPDGGRIIQETVKSAPFEGPADTFTTIRHGKVVHRSSLPSMGVQSSTQKTSCPREVNSGEVEDLVARASNIAISVQDQDSPNLELRIAGARTQFSLEGCERYSASSGNFRLADDLEAALQTGLSCLAGTGPQGALGPRARIEAARLVAYLQSSARGTIQCMEETRPKSGCFNLASWGEKCLRSESPTEIAGADARAISCPNEGAPGFLINSSNARTTTREDRRDTLFHEMMHWLGYRHYSGERGGVDVPYLAAQCCMSGISTACDLLKASDPGACGLPRSEPEMRDCPMSASSMEYTRWFTRLMVNNGRSGIGYTTAATASFRNPEVAWTDGKTYPNLSVLMKSIQTPADRPRESRTARAALAYAAAGNVINPSTGQFFERSEVEGRLQTYFGQAFDSSPSEQRILQFTESLGRMFSETLNRYTPSPRFREMLDRYRATRAEACAAMTAGDRGALGTFKSAVIFYPGKVPSELKCIVLASGGPCSPDAGRCN